MRVVIFLLSAAVAGCSANAKTIGAPRPEVLRDVEGYAIASCLTNQTQPYLMDQGDAWASVIVQRMKGNLEVLAGIAEIWGQCGLAMSRSLVGGNPTWVIVSREPSIEPCGANGNGRVDA